MLHDMMFLLGILSNSATAAWSSPNFEYRLRRWLEMNLSEEHPEVIIKEWSCFPRETDFVGMQAWMRFENKRGSAHISDTKLWNASLMCPLEHKVANCSLPSEKFPSCKWVLKVMVDKWEIDSWKMVGTETKEKLVRGRPNLPMHTMSVVHVFYSQN